MKYIDLFAGCGGLSLGFERAGFELVLAVEKSDMAAHTFYHNFVNEVEDYQWQDYVSKDIHEQFKSKVISKELGELLLDKKILKKIRDTKVDIVVGGPPCQGFSLAGRRNPDDERNQLPWQFLEFVEHINPRAVVIENVVGMSKDFKKLGHKAPFKQLQEALSIIGIGYVVQGIQINAVHYGVPEHRPRMMLLALRNDVAKKRLIEASDQIWSSDFLDEMSSPIPPLAPKPNTKKSEVLDLQDAIGDLNGNLKSNPHSKAKKFLKEMKDASLWKLRRKSRTIENHNRSQHQDKTILRFKLYQYLLSQGLPPNILNIPAKKDNISTLEILNILFESVKLPAKAPDGSLLARNKLELINLVIDLKTKKHSQRALSWNKPSPTVVTLPDDYVHPSEPRIFSVRELARMQSFPDDFVFKSKETTGSERRKFEVPQYSQVGNAVAPLVAYSVAEHFYEILNRNEGAVTRRIKKA